MTKYQLQIVIKNSEVEVTSEVNNSVWYLPSETRAKNNNSCKTKVEITADTRIKPIYATRLKLTIHQLHQTR